MKNPCPFQVCFYVCNVGSDPMIICGGKKKKKKSQKLEMEKG